MKLGPTKCPEGFHEESEGPAFPECKPGQVRQPIAIYDKVQEKYNNHTAFFNEPGGVNPYNLDKNHRCVTDCVDGPAVAKKKCGTGWCQQCAGTDGCAWCVECDPSTHSGCVRATDSSPDGTDTWIASWNMKGDDVEDAHKKCAEAVNAPVKCKGRTGQAWCAKCDPNAPDGCKISPNQATVEGGTTINDNHSSGTGGTGGTSAH